MREDKLEKLVTGQLEQRNGAKIKVDKKSYNVKDVLYNHRGTNRHVTQLYRLPFFMLFLQ